LFFFLLILHKKLTTDILYVRGSAFGFGPILFAKLLKIPCLVEINGIWKEEQKLSLNNYSLGKKIIIRPILYLRHLSLLFICKLADIIIAVTPGIAEFLGTNNINTDKIHVVPNGVNIDRFSPHNKEECKNLLPIDDKYNYIGYIGSLSPWQGVDDLLTTFTKFNSTEGYKLLIVGDGEYRQKLEMLVEKYNIKEKVIFTGSQPYHLIPYFICGCEILVTPKKKLSSGYSPLKIYEYLACGRPVIASNVAGLEFIEKNKLGYLYEAGNTEHMFDSIMKLINLSENRKIEKGKKCRKYAEENCSWESTVLKIYDLIN